MPAAKKAKYTKAKEEQQSTAERFRERKRAEFNDWLESTFTPEALEGVELFDVPVGGEIFQCRKLTPEFGMRMGSMPTGLAAFIASGGSDDPKDQQKAWEAMPDADKLRSLEMLSGLVRFVCVSPRVVIQPRTPSELAVGELGGRELTEITSWAKGGDAAARLENFRPE